MPGGGPTQNQNQSQSSNTTSSTSPWGPAVPLLSGILDNLGTYSTDVTPDQTSATNVLNAGANAQPNFGPAGTKAADALFSSNTLPEQGLLTTVMGDLNKAYGSYKDASAPISGMLSQYLNPNYLNPMTNPNIKGFLDTLNSDTTNQVNDQFAAAGRAWSPGHAMALARGITSGEAPVLANQYNANVAAQQGAGSQLSGLLSGLFGGANSVFGAGNTTAQGLNTLNQTTLANGISGAGLAGQLPGLYTGPGTSLLGAANTTYGLPYANLASKLGLATPLAGLGSSSTGSSSGTGSGTASIDQPFGAQQILGLLAGGAGAAGKLFSLSDARLKDDIQHVGELKDGQPVFSYHFKGDPTRRKQIGLLAQFVAEEHPDAVADLGGVLAVDYGKATERASAMAA